MAYKGVGLARSPKVCKIPTGPWTKSRFDILAQCGSNRPVALSKVMNINPGQFKAILNLKI